MAARARSLARLRQLDSGSSEARSRGLRGRPPEQIGRAPREAQLNSREIKIDDINQTLVVAAAFASAALLLLLLCCFAARPDGISIGTNLGPKSNCAPPSPPETEVATNSGDGGGEVRRGPREASGRGPPLGRPSSSWATGKVFECAFKIGKNLFACILSRT